MKKPEIKSSLISVLAVFLLYGNAGFAQTKNFDEALELAKKQKKKIIVDVYTDWCGWCKKMDREAYSDKSIKNLIAGNFILVRLDAEGSGKSSYKGKTYTDAELAGYFQVSGYPTTVFLNSDGSVIEFKYDNFIMNNLPGYYTVDEFKKVLEFIKDEKYLDTDLGSVL